MGSVSIHATSSISSGMSSRQVIDCARTISPGSRRARLRCLASHQRARPSRKPIAEFVANKPKALSAENHGRLGTKTRSEGRAVLVSAKTMPCPNKLCPRLARNGAVVVNSLWLALSRHSLSRDGALSKEHATWRQTTPSNDSRRHKTPTGAKAATTRTKNAKKVSRVGSFIPAVVSRLSRGLRKWDVWARATSRGAKPIT